MVEGPSVDDINKLIDSNKNILIAVMVLLMGFWVTVRPGIPETYATRWIDAAMLVVGFYVGKRSGSAQALAQKVVK